MQIAITNQKTNTKKFVKTEKKTLTKKEYILMLLNAFMNKRPLAKWLKTLVESWSLDEKTIDSLVEIFKKVIKNVSNKLKKDNLIKWLSMMEKVKQNEIQVTENEQENLDVLLSGI